MKHVILLAPAGAGVGLSTIAAATLQALKNTNIRVKNFAILDVGLENIEKRISNNELDDLLDDIYKKFVIEAQDTDIVVVEGMSYASDRPYALGLN